LAGSGVLSRRQEARRVSSIKAACAGLFVAAVILGTSQVVRAANDCLTGPNRQPGLGGHWYFHSDPATDRKCWYLVVATAPAPAVETVQPQQAKPQPQSQPASGSFFSSPGFTGSTTHDPNSSDPRILLPTRPDDGRSDDGALGRQSPIARRPVAEASPAPKPRRPAPARALAQRADDQAAPSKPVERDALFQEFLKWRQRR
jgi:hypothetical protein